MVGNRRDLLAALIAVAGGLGLAFMDSRPGFDATGITAIGLWITGAASAFVGGRRPWLWAIATGIWVPLLEFPWLGGAGAGPLAALLFAGVGALVGWTLARFVAPR